MQKTRNVRFVDLEEDDVRPQFSLQLPGGSDGKVSDKTGQAIGLIMLKDQMYWATNYQGTVGTTVQYYCRGPRVLGILIDGLSSSVGQVNRYVALLFQIPISRIISFLSGCLFGNASFLMFCMLTLL